MTRIELKKKREHDKRIGYQKACRRIIAYQIDNWKTEHNATYTGRTHHLDHLIPFALIVDCFRELIKTYLNCKKLPTSISEFSSIGKMFAKYHNAVAEYELIPAKDNLTKASGQTRTKLYGLDLETFKLYAIKCKKEFLKLTDGVSVAVNCKRVPKPQQSLQEYCSR